MSVMTSVISSFLVRDGWFGSIIAGTATQYIVSVMQILLA